MASGDVIRKGSARSARLAADVGRLLTAARGARTRADMARQIGVTTSTLAGLERGQSNPTLAYLERVGAAYGVEFDITCRPAGEAQP